MIPIFLHKIAISPLRRVFVVVTVLVVSLSFFSTALRAQEGFIPSVSKLVSDASSLVHANLSEPLKGGKIAGVTFVDPEGLHNFYKERNFEPVWIKSKGQKIGRVDDILEVVEKSWTHGFNPYDYNVLEMRSLMEHKDDGQSFHALELLASDAVVRYVRDLSAMRVSKGQATSSIRAIQLRPVTESVLGMIAENSDIEEALEAFVPRGTFYATLQAQLVELVKGPPAPYEGVLPIRIKGFLKPGQSSDAVPSLRARLDVRGEGKEYDDTLAKAVMDFQRQNGLVPDAVIGVRTLELLNLTRAAKIERIVANLERLRWIAREKPDRYILVNIPSATLWAIEDGKTVLEMPVILGRKERATESFITDITGVRFNPNWTVPPTIKREDFLPHLAEDPLYASDRGIELVQGYGKYAQTLDPTTVNWSEVSWEDFKDIQMIQAPGSSNPLGKVRVLMPNPYNIYLHDTNKREYFKNNDRYISSGCIRVSKPFELAEFIMKSNSDWKQGSLETLLENGKTRDVPVDNPLPVLILYQTIWAGEGGHLVFGPDIYGLDAKLMKEIRAKNLFRIPESSTAAAVSKRKGGASGGMDTPKINE